MCLKITHFSVLTLNYLLISLNLVMGVNQTLKSFVAANPNYSMTYKFGTFASYASFVFLTAVFVFKQGDEIKISKQICHIIFTMLSIVLIGADVYQTKQSVSVLVVSRGSLFLNTNELHNKSWNMKHTQAQFITFLGFNDIPTIQ